VDPSGNFSAAHLARLAATGRELPEVLQVELHLVQQQQELTAYCAGNGIAVMAASPLARGQLCRPSHGSFPDAWRSLAGMAAKKGRSQAEIAVRWCLQRGYIAVPKSKSQGHVEANAAFGFELTSADAG
ncbi:ytbE, partial [Symbiodinium necroappetens]